MEYVKPLKRFGQNYLQDPNILNKITSEINPQADDTIIEIGPGLGALTGKIISSGSRFTAVEIDSRASSLLKKQYPDLNIIEQDFLELDLNSFYSPGNKLRIIGNIPYNITSPIIFKLIRSHGIIQDSVLMVQYEVAKRMTAVRGSKDYGILAVLLKYYCETKLAFKVSPGAFYPKPNVDSAIIHLIFKEVQSSKEEDETFIASVKAAFGNRRKTLKNSLGNGIFKDIDFEESGIDLSLRAEQLDIAEFKTLSEFIRRKKLSSLNPGG